MVWSPDCCRSQVAADQDSAAVTMQWMQWVQWMQGMEVYGSIKWNTKKEFKEFKSCQCKSVPCTEIFRWIRPSKKTANTSLAKKERNQSLPHRMPWQRKLRKVAQNTWAPESPASMVLYDCMVPYGSLVFEHPGFKVKAPEAKSQIKQSSATTSWTFKHSADHQLPNYANWNLNSNKIGAADPHVFTNSMALPWQDRIHLSSWWFQLCKVTICVHLEITPA